VRIIAFALSLLIGLLSFLPVAWAADMDIQIQGDDRYITVKDDGSLYGPDQNLVGKVKRNGEFADLEGNVLFKLEKDGKLLDRNGGLLFTVENTGKMVNLAGQEIGKLDKQGNLLSPNGEKVGGITNCCTNTTKMQKAAAFLLTFVAAGN
jgi:flagellar basal body rod protein FlgG